MSSNGASNGVLWIRRRGANVLHAYDAANISTSSTTQPRFRRDALGTTVRFNVPMIANGKVYIGTSTEVVVYGLLP